MGLTFKPVDSEQSRLLSIMWWASFRQLKALKRKLEVPWRGRGSSSRLKHRNFAWASSLQTQDYKSNSCWKFKPASLYTHTCTPPPHTHTHTPHPPTHTHTHTHTPTHTPIGSVSLENPDIEAIWLTWASSAVWCDLHFRNHCYFRERELSLGSERKAERPGRLSWSCRCDLTVAWQWLEVTGFEKYFAGFSDSSDEACERNR